MNIKVLKLQEYVDKLTNHKEQLEPDTRRIVILKGEKQWLLVDNEAVHIVCDNDKDIEAYLYEKNKDGQLFEMKKATATLKISPNLLETSEVPTEEMPLGKFVKKFGQRIENNYRLLLDSIKEIGLDPGDYPRNI